MSMAMLITVSNGLSVSALFNGDDYDGIVPLNSAMWIRYIPGSADGTYIRKVNGAPHLGMGTNTSILSITEKLLNSTELKKFYIST